ncbi:MAG: hypothetical protein ACK50Y_04440 [Flavobacteriia bacterium]
MKNLLIIIPFLTLTNNLFAQDITLNETTEKYEMSFDLTVTSDSINYNFDYVEEWLVTSYSNKYSSSKLSNKEKGKIIYGAAFETHIFPTKGLISFNYTIKFEGNKIIFFVTDFAYTMIGQMSTGAGAVMNLESKGLAGKKKIIEETQTKIREAIKKIEL